jgi:phenylacetate-CoA ligase
MLPPLFPPLVRNVIYPLYRGLRGDRLISSLEELEKSQWLTADELKEVAWRRMEQLLQQITTHVPYYRDLFRREGLRVEDIQNPSDLQRIPFLTKELIREAKTGILSTDPFRRGLPSNTGGSTGEPLYFYVDLSTGSLRSANSLRSLRWTNIDIGDRQAVVWGFHLDRPWRERFTSAIKDYFNNQIYVSSFDMSEQAMTRYAGILVRFKPDLLIGYPSALSQFAEFCKNRRITRIKPRATISSGERIFPHQADIIREVFRAPLFDRYGSNEFATVAQECDRHRGLHVFSDVLHVEVIHESGRPAQSGEVGELVVTDLLNFYMPFVRYRTGDLAVPTARTCSCGRGLPLLDRIEGRTFDAVVTADGRSTGGFFWTYLSRLVPGIRQFQIEQRERSGVIFRIVPGPEWKDEYRRELEEKIKENMGRGFGVHFEIVQEIPLTRAGKFRFISSKLGERLVVKSKIHKARVTGETHGRLDCVIVDEELLERSNIAPFERVLLVDNTNGARLESFVVKGKRGSGELVVSGAVAHHIHAGDEIIVMAFTWSEQTAGFFKNILVDEHNRFVRYLTEVHGDTAEPMGY